MGSSFPPFLGGGGWVGGSPRGLLVALTSNRQAAQKGPKVGRAQVRLISKAEPRPPSWHRRLTGRLGRCPCAGLRPSAANATSALSAVSAAYWAFMVGGQGDEFYVYDSSNATTPWQPHELQLPGLSRPR